MQQKIGFASMVILIAMLFVLAAWGGSPPAAGETATFTGVVSQENHVVSR